MLNQYITKLFELNINRDGYKRKNTQKKIDIDGTKVALLEL